MKSYNHLWEKFISKENIEKSIKDASKGKRSRNSVKARLNNPNLIEKISDYANNFRNKKHKPKEKKVKKAVRITLIAYIVIIILNLFSF